jgi:hypothetical protein
LGLGAFSVVNFQTVEGPQGIPGDDGQDAPGGFIIRILDPDNGETITGVVIIKTLIYGSENYSVSVLRNGTEIGTSLSMTWNTSSVVDGWWNITIIATDLDNNKKDQDTVVLYVENINVDFRVKPSSSYAIFDGWNIINYSIFDYGEDNNFNLATDTFTAPKDGYYYINTHISVLDMATDRVIHLCPIINGTLLCYVSEWSSGVHTDAHYSDVLWLRIGSTFQMRVWTNDDSIPAPDVFDDGTYLTINLL